MRAAAGVAKRKLGNTSTILTERHLSGNYIVLCNMQAVRFPSQRRTLQDALTLPVHTIIWCIILLPHQEVMHASSGMQLV